MGDLKRWYNESRVAMGMLMVQVFAVGLQLLSRIILSQGTFIFALMTYRQFVGAICVAPLAFYFDRGNFKKLTMVVLFWLFMVALTGISVAMGLFYFGLRDTSATYATNFLNLIPIVTFLFSTILRIEKLGLHTRAGKIKTMGAILCLAGALTISLYKGKAVISHHNQHPIIKETHVHRTRGTLFLVGSILSYGLWFICQVKLFKVFPYKYAATLFICIIAMIQQVVLGVCIDRSKSAWRLGWNLQLITIVYSGALATAATFCLISWAVAQRGPTYPSMFNPLALIGIAIIEALFMSEDLTVGSLIGMVLIILGLYSFLWAKSKEFKSMKLAAEAAAAATELAEINVGSDSRRMHSAAIVVPTISSPKDLTHVENIDPNKNKWEIEGLGEFT